MVRGAEIAMLRQMIPPPYQGEREMTTSQRIEEHKAHIRKTLRELNYVSIDRKWIKRHHGWAGHVVRLPTNRWARKLLFFKNVAWWRKQQQQEKGHRHNRTRGNVSRWENVLVRHHHLHAEWHREPPDRIEWEKHYKAFEKGVFGTNSPHIFPHDENAAPKDGERTPRVPQTRPAGRQAHPERSPKN